MRLRVCQRARSNPLALLEHQFKTAKIQVQSELYSELSPIQGNAGRLQQVFLNLFLNAKDAMAGGGQLRVATSNGDFVSVRVSDTGSGIPPEHIPSFRSAFGVPDGYLPIGVIAIGRRAPDRPSPSLRRGRRAGSGGTNSATTRP